MRFFESISSSLKESLRRFMELELSITAAFDAVRGWATKAAHITTSSEHPSLDQLRFVIEKRRRSIVHVDDEIASYHGRSVIGFQLVGEGNVGNRTRHVLPVHFVIMRLLELVPGISMRLNDDSHRKHFNQQGIDRPDEDLIYTLGIYFAESLAKEFGLPKRSRLDRVLFNAPPDTKLNPRRTGDHHFVVPSGSVLMRVRRGQAQTQETWLKVVASSIRKAKLDELRELPEILRLLFVVADRWHWDELLDRLDDDPRLVDHA
jgi:hypothetical protein